MTSTNTAAHAGDIARTIRQQTGIMPLMALGATEFKATSDQDTGRPGLTFIARIIPFTKKGPRGIRPRRMRVSILLDASGTYTVSAMYNRDRAACIHFIRSGIHADQLATLLLALDYDGDTAINPRLA